MTARQVFFVLLVLAGLVEVSLSCQVSSLDVVASGVPANLTQDAYTSYQVLKHFQSLEDIPFASDVNTTFSCVDARLDSPVFGTPGGDFAELVVALKTYFDMKNITPSATVIRRVFLKFMTEVATPQRPFYYHTDFTRMNYFFADLRNFSIKATIFPERTPSQSEVWLREYVKPKYQGCGHIRLMMEHPQFYGLPDAFIPQTLLRQYLQFYWTSSVSEKAKIEFSVKLGTLSGKSVAVVKNVGPGCLGHSPKVITNNRGSSLFVFHAAAVANFREKVLAPLIHSYDSSINQAEFVTRFNALFDVQLGATLSPSSPGLPPANAVRVFTLEVSTSGQPDVPSEPQKCTSVPSSLKKKVPSRSRKASPKKASPKKKAQ